MCLAFPCKIKKIEGRRVTLDSGRYALVGDDPVKVGDYVMVQMGIIVKILSRDEAQSAIMAWGGDQT